MFYYDNNISPQRKWQEKTMTQNNNKTLVLDTMSIKNLNTICGLYRLKVDTNKGGLTFNGKFAQ